MPVQSTLAGAVSMLAFIGQASAFWRMECHSPIGYARMDPLVEPGEIADHAHAIHGGQNFHMNSDYNALMESTCTSCRVTQDKSAYWTPSLHFVHPDGTSELVPQVGGMLAYYLLYGDNLKAFPEDFRMLAGDTRQRNFTYAQPDPPKPWSGEDATQKALSQKALGFNCLNYGKNPPEATLYRHTMPSKEFLDANCVDGIRMELMFPSCWNGVDLDTPNHKSHMAYPSMTIDGECPEGFNTRVPSLLYETIWNTHAFAGKEGQFVFANGDPTGCGYHGDFMTGWDVKLLQDSIDTCTNPSGRIEDCPLFNLQSEQEAATCKLTMPDALQDDDCHGPRAGLPGDVPIQYGSAYASPLHGSGAPTGAYSAPAYSAPAYSAPASSAPVYTPPAITGLPVLDLPGVPGTRPVTDANGGGVTVAKVADGQDAAPAPTVAAVFAEEEDDDVDGRVVSTSTYTSNGAVYEVVYEEVDVTVTADPAAATPAKERRHQHHARHHRNNLV